MSTGMPHGGAIMTISNEVVVVALQAWRGTPYGGDALMEALKAAAPIVRAEALEEAADTIEARRPEMGPGTNITQYREGRDDAFSYAADICRIRAANLRQP